jgi:hypothetical protein
VEGACRLCCDRVRQTGVSKANEGLQLMSQATQVAALLFGELWGDRWWGNFGGGLAGNTLLPWLAGGASSADALRSVGAGSIGSIGGGSGRPGAAGGYAFLVHSVIVSGTLWFIGS